MKGYKVLNEDLTPCHGGTGVYVVGEWMPLLRGTEICEEGLYHFCRDTADLLQWLGPKVHPCETRGKLFEGSDKAGARRIKIGPALDTWNERSSRLFACDCAERVAHLGRSGQAQKTIAVARRYANGEATEKELAAAWDAERAAAWDAERAAERAAARAAEREWQAERLEKYLTGDLA